MAGADQHGQEKGDKGRHEGDAVGVFAQQLFRDLDHPVHAAGGLQNAGAGHGRDDDVNDLGGRCAGLQVKGEDQHGQADARNRAQRQRTVARQPTGQSAQQAVG